jgi:WD40 repeat protein/serine/threonine protein kinase/DNA-binding XRE family transcriptional regulator
MNQEISFGQIVKERRTILGLTQAELARRVGCAAITIRKIEADALRPSVQVAELLAIALGIPEEDQLGFIRLARADLGPLPIPTPAPTPEEIGQEDLSGRAIRGFHLGELIGAGGFGVVYKAVQTTVEREVAVKIILPKYANHPDFIRRFEFEAQIVARLEHPFVVPLYDYWREPDAAYLIMRLLRGGSLESVLKQGALSLEQVNQFMQQIGLALHAAHRAGVIHRDIKPANILLDDDGNAYLADFGIAKDVVIANGNRTEIGGMVGSPAYISPEQIRAEPVKPQADIYCLGIMLFELLTGRKPFTGPTPVAYIQQHLQETPPSLLTINPALPAHLDQVIQKATAKHPADRYPDMLALLADFHQTLPTGGASLPATEAFSPELPRQELAALENPFKGLRPFHEADAADFYGRDTLIQELLTRLSETDDLSRFLVVVGPSGSGKSSVVRAGLIPALRRGGLPGSDNWFIVEMMPGSHPFEEIEAALLRIAVNPPESLLGQLREDRRGLLRAVQRVLPADPNVELLLVIDQFEELFTLVADEASRAQFLDSLVEAVLDERSRLRLVVTLRADFVDRPLQYVDFGELVRQRTEFVLPLTPDELEQAITRPVTQLGLAVEQELVSRIVREVGDQPGALPLLQYALTELFEQRTGGLLTRDLYESSGGVLGALGRRAEEIYNSLDVAAQVAARQLFLRLITLGEGVEDTRRRVLRSELLSLGDPHRPRFFIQHPLEEFGKYRLLTFDRDPINREPTVEVAHEALLREWSRLRDWLTESRADIRWQRQLATATAEWMAAQQDASFLLRGSRLDQFAEWEKSTNIALTPHERAFVDASLEERQNRQATEAERQAHERALEQRSRRFLLALVGVFAVGTLIALVLWNSAQSNFTTSERTRLAAQAQIALDQGEEATLPALLALRSLRYGYSPEADAALLTALSRGFSRQAYLGHTGPLSSATFSPDGKYVLTGSNDTTVRLWDRQSGQEVRQFPGHTDFVVAAFSPDGRQLITGSADRTARLWDSETALELLRLPDHSSAIFAIAFSPDGKYVVTNDGPTARLWDAQTGEEVRQFEGHGETILGVSFSPDGRYLATASIDRTAILWDLGTGQVSRTFSGHAASVNEAIFSPDGRFLLTASLDTTARLWQIETGEAICSFLGHTSVVHDVAFSPDGRLVITGSGDKTAHLWDAATCREIRRFIGHTGEVDSVAFSPDGRYVLTSSVDHTVRLWDVSAEIEPRVFAPPPGAIHADDVILLLFTPDGSQILIGNGSGRVALWDVETRQILQSSGFESGFINAMGFSPTGENVLTAGGDGTATLWDSRSGQPVRLFTDHVGPIWDTKFSPDGRAALTGGEDSTARLWDVQTGATIYRLSGHAGPIYSVAFSPDGRWGLTGGDDFTTRLWNLETGLEIRQFAGHEGPVQSVAFSPDGRLGLTGSDDFTARLWNLESGQVVQQFVGHTGQVLTAIFSPDSRYVLTGSADQTVRLWDMETGQVIRQFPDQGGPVGTLAFSPDGQLVLAGSLVAAYLWRTTFDEVIAITCAQLGRDFTLDERALYTIPVNESTCPQ